MEKKLAQKKDGEESAPDEDDDEDDSGESEEEKKVTAEDEEEEKVKEQSVWGLDVVLQLIPDALEANAHNRWQFSLHQPPHFCVAPRSLGKSAPGQESELADLAALHLGAGTAPQ